MISKILATMAFIVSIITLLCVLAEGATQDTVRLDERTMVITTTHVDTVRMRIDTTYEHSNEYRNGHQIHTIDTDSIGRTLPSDYWYRDWYRGKYNLN